MERDKITNLKIAPNKKSGWLEIALYFRENRKWLNYSSKIAMRILAKKFS